MQIPWNEKCEIKQNSDPGVKTNKTMLIPIICFILKRNYHKDLFSFVAGVGRQDLSASASRAAAFEANLPLPREGQLCERKLNRHSNVTNVCLSISAARLACQRNRNVPAATENTKFPRN